MNTIILGRTRMCSVCPRSAPDSLILLLSYFRTKCIKLGVMQCEMSARFICEASERTAIMFCVWERPLLPVLRYSGVALFCPKSDTKFTRSTNGTYCLPLNGSPSNILYLALNNGSNVCVWISSFDFVPCPGFYTETTTFRKLVSFPSSGGEDMKRFLFCWAPRWSSSDNQQGVCDVI